MKNRSRLFIFGAALSGCLVLLVCAAVVGLGGFLVLSNGNPIAALASSSNNRIVYLGNDGNVYVIDPGGQHKTQLTKDADGGTKVSYDYPTWAPDGRHIAFVRQELDSGQPKSATIYISDPSGAGLTQLYKSDQDFPFFLYWSPDSRRVTFLANKGQDQLAIQIADSGKPNSAQELAVGAPLFFAWSPDAKQMFVHSGGTRAGLDDASMSVLQVGQKAPEVSLSDLPGTFQAPQWSPDGKELLFSRDNAGKQVLAVSNAQGDNAKVLLNYDGRISFGWSPDGKRIAYIITDPSLDIPNFGQVQVMDANGQNQSTVSPDHALAFYWSPNGKRLAMLMIQTNQGGSSGYRFIGPAQQGSQSIALEWKVKDFDTGQITTAATFSPTQDAIGVIPFFDQYARSAMFWSPDSQSIVYAASDATNKGTIWIADVSGKSPPRQLVEGAIAFWSWR